MLMRYQNNNQTPRWRALPLLLVSCALFTAAMPSPQNQDDETRRLWNKQFMNARERVKKPRPAPRPKTARTKTPATVKPAPKPEAASNEAVDEQLIGVTIWRLPKPAANASRLLTEEKGAAPGKYALERVTAETTFEDGQLLRISVEAPRAYNNYLYVVDREVFKESTGERLGEPTLIFPARRTPPGGNEISAGKSVYVPAQGDPVPYFTLQRSGATHLGEMLIILISPKPLSVDVERPALDPAAVEQWERQCGGQTERRESRASAGKQQTKAEQEADEGKRKLVQADPLPQTIYRVRANPDGCALVAIPLRIAP
jgi:hypothetical protein